MSSIAALRLLCADTSHAGDDRARPSGPEARDTHEQIATQIATTPSIQDHTIAALRAGDARVFEQLFRDHYLPLRRFARMLLQTDHDAADVVEDVFTWLWASREQLDIQGTFTSYLYSAVRHRALNAARNEKKHADLEARFARDIVTRASGAVASDDEDTDLLTAVRAVIAQLPERRRLAITLRWEGGLGNTEIAAILGVAPQSVANLLQRALADLRAAFPGDLR